MLNLVQDKPKAKKSAADSTLFSDAHVLDARRGAAWLEDRIKAASRLPPTELHSEVVTITPALAEIILAKCNKGNRTLRKKRVDAWAEAITQGRWKLTSQGISFSREGLVNNGQHRLTGIVKAGRSVQMMVTFGEDRDVFDVLDSGAVRGGSDVLQVAGYKNTAAMAASARLLGIVTSDRPTANLLFSNDVLKEIVSDHPRLEEMTNPGCRIGKKLKTSVAAVTVGFYLIATSSKQADRLDFFVERLFDGADLRRRNPILVLRDGLKDKEIAPVVFGASSGRITAAVILAWNLWLRGRSASLSSLRWDGAAHPFPQPE